MPVKKRSNAQIEHFKAARKVGTKMIESAHKAADLAAEEAKKRRASLTEVTNEPPDLRVLYQRRHTCGCDGCNAVAKKDQITISKTFLTQSTLRNQAGKLKELAAHGVSGLYENGKPVTSKVLHAMVDEHLVKKGAYVLTAVIEEPKTKKKKKVRIEFTLYDFDHFPHYVSSLLPLDCGRFNSGSSRLHPRGACGDFYKSKQYVPSWVGFFHMRVQNDHNDMPLCHCPPNLFRLCAGHSSSSGI